MSPGDTPDSTPARPREDSRLALRAEATAGDVAGASRERAEPLPDLFERTRRGDRLAFDRLVAVLWDPVMRVLWPRLPREDAMDAAQTVFASLYRTLRHGGGPPSGDDRDCLRYVVAAAKNQVADLRRREAARPALVALEALFEDGSWADEIPGDPRAPGAAAGAEDRERTKAVTECLGRLEVLPRAVCWLHFVEGIPKREVARVLARPESTVRLVMTEALRALRRCLEPKGHAPAAGPGGGGDT